MEKIDEVKTLLDESIKDYIDLKNEKTLTDAGEGQFVIAKIVSETLGTERGLGCLVMIALIAEKLGSDHIAWVTEYQASFNIKL